MKRITSLTILLLMIHSTGLIAQEEETGGVWTTLAVEKKFKKFELSTEAEMRTANFEGEIDRWSMQVDGAYSIIKQLKVGASYQFIYLHDFKYEDYQPRNRFSLYLQGKQKFGNFTLSLREKVQVTTKDDSDRIKASGLVNTYAVNPEWTWRNKVKLAYNIPRFPVTPAFSLETYYQLNNPDGNTFEKLRYTLSLNYKPSKQYLLEVFGQKDREINVENPETNYVIGLGLTYSF